MADWEEIKRLAADFQRTQTSDTLQRISERNCIDIVKKLTDLKFIDLIYTCDGKEFVTPNHLLKEITDEVYVHGGRVHLHDLATALNVDYQHVENMAKTIVAERPDEYNLILGQIIHSTYKTTLEKQIYDTMIATGQLSIADFAKTLDLPSEFLSSVVKELLPRVMDDFVVSPDERTYYTTDMMDRYKSIISGTLTAITKPTNIASIMKKLDIPERLFTPIIDGLIKQGRVDASVENRLYIPAVYAREQSEWVDKFYSSNLYIEYDMLSRMDIKQPKTFLKKRFPDGLQLKTCFVSPALVLQVESMIEDCIATNGLIDISTILPPSIQAEDIDQLLHDTFKKNKQFSSSCLIINHTNVCSLGFIATCKHSFTSMMKTKAQEHLKEGRLVSYFLGGQLKKKGTSDKSKNQQDESEGKNAETRDSSERIEPGPPDQGGANSESGEKKALSEQNTEKETKSKAENIELTAEDLKREKRQKKGKASAKATEDIEVIDSDEDQGGKRGGKGSRRSGGGAQGREIKQKAVKKKYLAGSKGRGGNNDDSEDETPAKAPKSNKSRAARRAVSPERKEASTKTASSNKRGPAGTTEKEPLVFMNNKELVDRLKEQSREAGDFSSDGVLKSIANMIESDLNKAYETLAHSVLDEFMRSLNDDSESREEELDETLNQESQRDGELVD